MKKDNSRLKIVIAIVLIVIIGIVVFMIFKGNDKTLELTEISNSDIKYYRIIKEDKIGVINKDGDVIIEPQYTDLRIPNPTLDVFVCTSDTNTSNAQWKAINSQGQAVYDEYDGVEAIPINQISSNIPYEKTVLKYKKNNMYGLINFEGKVVLPAEYEEISNVDYKEGYVKIKKEGLYGVADINGNIILKPNYYNISSDRFFNEKSRYAKAGFILQIKSDNGYKYGYADTKGKLLVETSYNDIMRITEIEDDKETYLITSANGRYGLIKNEKIILENEYDSIEYDKITNLIVVSKGNKYGALKLDGSNVIPIEYDAISIGGDYINAYKDKQRSAVYDKNGNTVDTLMFSHLSVSNNYSVVIDENNNYNITDSSNNTLLKEKYIYIEYYRDNLFIATKGATSGIINTNGNEVVPIKYSTIQKIDGTDLLEATANGQTDLINGSGTVIQGIKNGVIEKHDNYIKMYSENDMKYYDFSGNEKSYKDFVTGNKLYADKKDNKWGFVDANGNKVVDYMYEMVTEQNGNFLGVKWNGKWGVINTEGKGVINPTYNLNWNNVKFLSNYYKLNNKTGEEIYSADIIE